MAGGLDNATGSRRIGQEREPEADTWDEAWLRLSGSGCEIRGLANSHIRHEYARPQTKQQTELTRRSQIDGPGPTNGIWRSADWLYCRDGKWRPVEPGTFPLAHGAASRVGRLRAYGNAINVEQAKEFILAHDEAKLMQEIMQ
jgi:DNA (cytosine-5)-methyltransferase 1